MPENWEVSFFRGVALDFWRQAVTPELTRADADFLEQTLGLSRGSRVLDVPCGNGRHSIELARRGYTVAGVDISEEFIAEAEAASRGLPATWLLADMRELPWSAEFDGGFCFGNSFGYLSPEQAPRFLAAVARVLKPGGKFVIETGMAAESILPGLQKKKWFQTGDIYTLSENRYDAQASRLDIDYTFIRGGVTETRPTSSYVLTVNEICRMHTAAGLTPTALLGSLKGEAYQLSTLALPSPRLLLVSERSA
jgi:SAM-dependent methyltransferase